MVSVGKLRDQKSVGLPCFLLARIALETVPGPPL